MPAQRIAAAVRKQRMDLTLSQEALAKRAGVGLKVVKNLEGGRTQISRITEQLRRVEQALGWAPGSLVAIGRGEAPTPLGDHGEDETSLERKLPVKVSAALGQEVLDYDFQETEVDGVTQIVVTVRDPSLPPLTTRERSALVRLLTRKKEDR